MKFVFDRAVKGSAEGFGHVWRQIFTGSGPWLVNEQEYSDTSDWFDFAKKTGRALGIIDCECSIDITGTDKTTCTFSFQKAQDYRSFGVAVFGDLKGENKWEHTCNSAQEKQEMIPLLINLLKQNEIPANITNEGPTTFCVYTNSRFDSFQIMSAFDSGRLTPSISNQPAPPTNTP